MSATPSSDVLSKEEAIELMEKSGNIRLLEHINLSNMEPCTEASKVYIFYMKGLLCARDPRLDYHFWANFGRNQFHLFTGQPEDQCFPGTIVLFFPDLNKVEKSLESIKEELKGTEFTFERFNRGGKTTSDLPRDKWHEFLNVEQYDHIKTKDPYGNQIVLLNSPAGYWDLTKQLGALLPGEGESDGMPFMVYPVRPGIAQGIADFYAHYLDAKVVVTQQENTELLTAHVYCGPLQTLVFQEKESERENKHEYDGHHICIYIDNFKECYEKASRDEMQWNNVLFFDRCDTWEDAHRDQQYRILNIIDPKDKKVLMALEHEIRSVDNFRYGIHKRETEKA